RIGMQAPVGHFKPRLTFRWRWRWRCFSLKSQFLELDFESGFLLWVLGLEKLFRFLDAGLVVATVGQDTELQAANLRNKLFDVVDRFLGQRTASLAAGVVFL